MLLTPFPIGLVSDCRYRHNMVRSLEINVKEYIYQKDCFYLLYGKPKRVANALTACTQGIFSEVISGQTWRRLKKKIQARVRRGKMQKKLSRLARKFPFKRFSWNRPTENVICQEAARLNRLTYLLLLWNTEEKSRWWAHKYVYLRHKKQTCWW